MTFLFQAVLISLTFTLFSLSSQAADDKTKSLAQAVSEISAETSAVVSHSLFTQLPLDQRVYFHQLLPESHQRAFWKYRLQQALAFGDLDDKKTQVLMRTIEFINANQQNKSEFQQKLKSLEQEAVEAFGLEDAKRLFSIDNALYKNSI